jgi:hypothetical protein
VCTDRDKIIIENLQNVITILFLRNLRKWGMENKTARLTILIDPNKKEAFEELCNRQDLKPSQVVRQLIREYLEKNGVDYATKPSVVKK